ncbi:MAG TPA: hypothetical protein VGV07_08645 [Devosia sp.]|jgi:hypothetical protein|uniref:hypothetical protein n=1 Tax=Devosia sp. TaxID=1871048 RepID=UPI002DDD0E64|nr:hypothetical protein [Devosia sp.]HEV2515305.1 hypothetical protein [Devosia sp.]
MHAELAEDGDDVLVRGGFGKAELMGGTLLSRCSTLCSVGVSGAEASSRPWLSMS